MRYSRVDFDPHAIKRMRQRRIAERQVLNVLERPDRTHSGNQPGRIVVERDTEVGNTLRVVYEERDEGRTAYVITAIRMRR